MSTLDEEQSSICSPSVTNEKMLDYIIHGHSTKEHSNANGESIHYTRYRSNSENYSVTSAMSKNDTECYSDSSESLTHKNGSYVSEKAAFCNKENKVMPASVQEEKLHLENVIGEEVQSASSQIILPSPIPNGYITLDSQHQSTDKRATSPFQIEAEEMNENGKLPMLSEGEYFPDTTAEIRPTSDPSTSPIVMEEKYGNRKSPTISEGEYLPYTSAINQYDPASVTKLLENNYHMQQNCNTGMYNAVSMESLKEGTLITDNFLYVTLTEDDICHTAPHTHTCIDKETTIEYDASCTTDIISHSESCSDVFPPYIAYQDKCLDCNIDADQQSMQYSTTA